MSKISAMPELTAPATDDEIEVRDKSDTSQAATGTNKRMTWLTTITKIFASRFAADSGSTDTYIVTLDPVPAAYVNGEHYRFKANTVNTGAATVNFNSLGAKTIKKHRDQDLANGDIEAGQWVDLVYDSANDVFQMQSQLGNAPAGGAGGIGDVVGPASATDNALARYDTTTGKLIQNSVVTVDDDGAITIPEIAAPATPAAGKVVVYAKSDNKVYRKGEDGVEAELGGGGAGYAGVTTGGTGSLDMAQGTKTADEPFIDGSVTWNSSGITFVGLRLDVTNTASAVSSKLIDLLIGGSTVFRVDPSGSVGIADASLSLYNTADPDTGINLAGSDVITINNGGNLRHEFSAGEYRNLTASGIRLADSAAAFRWTSSTRLLDPGNGVLRIEGNSDAQGAGLLLGVNNATQGARLKRNGVRLEAKLGDDSAYTQMTCEKLGVNNSAAATTPGSVIKKIEVFDAAGNSLGFIAVYDSIT